ncbi:MAG: TVP38/TMEM64 family protein [Cyanobacteria bacterium J06623_4]
MRMRKQYWVLGLAAALCVIAASLCGWHNIATAATLLFDRAILTQFFADAGPGGICLFICAHVVANAVGVPGTLLVIVGGAVFGLWWGTVWSVLGATLGAIAAFLLARYLLYDWFKRRFHHRPFYQKVNTTLCDNALSCVLTVRFSPVSPFNVVNFVFGLTRMPVRPYAIGTLIGIIPGTLAYTWLGVTGAEALSGGSLRPLIVCLILLTLLSAIPLVIQRQQRYL